MTSTERVRAFRARNKAPAVIRHCPVCHTVIMGRGKTCSPRCRKALSRSKQRQAAHELAVYRWQSWESLDRDMLWQAVKDNPIRHTSMTPDGYVVEEACVKETSPAGECENIHIEVYSPDYNPNTKQAYKVYRLAWWVEGRGYVTYREGDCEAMVTAIQSVWADPEGCYNRWRDRLIELGGDKTHRGLLIPPPWPLREKYRYQNQMLLGESDDEYLARMEREEEQARRDSLISDAESETSKIMNEVFGYSWHLK